MSDVYVMGPYVKDEASCLNPGSWYEPDPVDRYGYMQGGIAWFFLVQGKTIAARSREAAEAAARRYIAEKALTPTWLDLDEARALDDGTWRCPGCGRRWQEVPTDHDYDRGDGSCRWVGRFGRTRWWPDGSVRDEYWTGEQR